MIDECAVAVLGHVDAGKTALTAAMSQVLSTAALDKHPASQARGITLDLGFSSAAIPVPSDWASRARAPDTELLCTGTGAAPKEPSPEPASEPSQLNLTFVDCPGHASLIKTVLGGAAIIDAALLVIDAVKGIQVQTVECIAIAEMVTDTVVVVMNKVDNLPGGGAGSAWAKQLAKVQAALRKTRFADAVCLPTAATTGEGVSAVLDALSAVLRPKRRQAGGCPIVAVDHCFPLRGQGTVLTGTVLQGTLREGDALCVPPAGTASVKVKSCQRFRKPTSAVPPGARVGMCVSGLDARSVERCLVFPPAAIKPIQRVLAAVRCVPWHKAPVLSGARMHCTVGHTTVMGKVHFFGARELAGLHHWTPADKFSPPALQWDLAQHWHWQDQALAGMVNSGTAAEKVRVLWQWAALEFDAPVFLPLNSIVVGSRLDIAAGDGTDSQAVPCRLAWWGRLLAPWPDHAPGEHPLDALRLYRGRVRWGSIDRVAGEDALGVRVIGKGLFSRDTPMGQFEGLTVHAVPRDVVPAAAAPSPAGSATREPADAAVDWLAYPAGTITGAFGKSGKFTVQFPPGHALSQGMALALIFRKYVRRGAAAAGTAAAAASGRPASSIVQATPSPSSK